ncbi:fimbria/pilus periplasmic chaperone [Ramlibacter terrae]|uniref:Fimbria/pilus periplasmic chaperone n=1 Tax=Ramlibacter terrae TaxID=2732511 RepID=A0ABX6P0D1_9BURK|nr:fimbria/pilus periplasmic chaperone [Ramlibacter terrae]
MVLAPPILKLAPRSGQVVRLANLRPVPGGAQQTYRMVVREIPEARPAGANVEVRRACLLAAHLHHAARGEGRLSCAASARPRGPRWLPTARTGGRPMHRP